MPDTTWEPSEAKLEGGLVVFLERVGQRIVNNDFYDDKDDDHDDKTFKG